MLYTLFQSVDGKIPLKYRKSFVKIWEFVKEFSESSCHILALSPILMLQAPIFQGYENLFEFFNKISKVIEWILLNKPCMRMLILFLVDVSLLFFIFFFSKKSFYLINKILRNSQLAWINSSFNFCFMIWETTKRHHSSINNILFLIYCDFLKQNIQTCWAKKFFFFT